MKYEIEKIDDGYLITKMCVSSTEHPENYYHRWVRGTFDRTIELIAKLMEVKQYGD